MPKSRLMRHSRALALEERRVQSKLDLKIKFILLVEISYSYPQKLTKDEDQDSNDSCGETGGRCQLFEIEKLSEKRFGTGS